MKSKQLARWAQRFFRQHPDGTATAFMPWCYPRIAKVHYRKDHRGLVVDYDPPTDGLNGRAGRATIGYLPLHSFDWTTWSSTLPPADVAWLVKALFTYDPTHEYVLALFRPEGIRLGRFAVEPVLTHVRG